MKKGFKKALLMLLSLVMVFTMMPLATMTAFADDATSAEVTFTLSNQGSFVAGKDGKAVVERPVTVTDLDGDGKLTYDDALVAAHDAYYEGGAAVGYDHGTGMVELLWGVSSKNNLFFINEVGLSTGVTADTIKDGDSLYASINADTAYYADWLSKFDNKKIEATIADDITVNLIGHLGMAYDEATETFVPLGGVQIGVWEDGAFKPIEGAVTGKDGNATFKLDAGEYILTAKGTVEDQVTNWNLIDLSNSQGYPLGTVSEDGEDWYVAYTDEDHGEGPYPADEVKYIDYFEEADENSENDYAWQDLHYLKSNQILAHCPIMAPYASVTVTEGVEPAAPAEVTFTMSNKGLLASAKDGTAVAEKPVTVTDLDEDGHLTYDEALVAAHNAYFEGGAEAGYALGSGDYGAFVSKLWGVDVSNTLFYTNGAGIPTGVTADTVEEGDSLYVSINADDAYYADWFTKFSEKDIEATDADDITVTLTGHLGMAFTEEDMKFVPLEGVQIGVWKDGAFEAIEGAATDADGKATFKLAAGEYILTAKGTVKDEITPWGASEAVTVDCPIMAPYAKVVVEESSALDFVLASIGGLSNDPRNFTAADAERVEAIQAAYEALSAEDQATVDSTFNHPSGDGQSYGRILEAAVWAVRSFTTDTSTTLAPGTYTTTTEPAVSSSSDKGKSDSSRVRNWVVESVEVSEDGQATAVIYVIDDKGKVLTSYPSVWVGGELYNKDSNNRYTIPVELNGITYLGGISSAMPRPIMYALSTTIEEPVPPLADGIYTLPELKAGPSDMFNHFEADTTYLVVNGDTATIRFITDGSTKSIQKYSRIALGKSSELVEENYQPELPEGTTIIDGVLCNDGSGKEKYLFKVEMPNAEVSKLLANEIEEDIYIVVWNKVGSSEEKIPGWYKAKDDIYLSLGQLGETAELKNGWVKEDGDWYYYEETLKITNKWKKDSKGWCYLGADGAMVTNDWAKDTKGWVYVGSNGYMVTGTKWMEVDGSWYHITNGYRDQSKWMKDSKGWCYLGADGAMVTNDWAKDSKGYVYVGADGYMVTGTKWLKSDGVWYHITNGYRDQNKWMKDSKGWCYLGTDGKMVTDDWAKDKKGYCWIGSEGYMIEETMWVGEAGVIGSSYIIAGYRVDNQTIEIDGVKYTFDEEGKLAHSDAAKIPYEENIVNFIKADGSQYGMFTPQDGTTVALDGDKVVIHFVPKNTTTYAGFNWGSIVDKAYKDESAQPAVEVKANEDGTYDLTLDKEYMGYAHPIAVVKKEFNKGSWTSADQFYLAVPMITDPAELTINNNTDMFKAVSAYLQKEGKQEYLVLALSGSGYHELFRGTYEEAVANGDGSKDNGNDKWVHGYQNKDGKWEFKIPVTDEDAYIPIVAISNSYYTKYLNGTNSLARAFYPRQFELDREAKTLTTDDYKGTTELSVTNNVSMFKPGDKAVLKTIGGPNSNGYGHFITLNMESGSYTKVRAKKYTNRGAEFIENGTIEIALGEGNVFADIPVLVNGETNVIEFWSARNETYYKRDLTIDLEAGTATFDPHKATIEDLEGLTDQQALEYVTANANVDLMNSLIEAIQVQERYDDTDLYCELAKACWDALPEADQQEDDGYFSEDTGNASADDPLNTAPDKTKELLVVSFGTSFNDSRVATIGAVEKALAAAYGDEYAVRRAFTAQIIINHIQSRDSEKIDNVKQAMDKAVAAGVEEMIVQPTHLMSGAEYDELKGEIDKYADKIDITYAKPLLDSDADKQAVAQAIVAAAVEDADYASLEAAAADGVAFVFMGHGTSHEANVTYTQMQQTMNTLGYANCFIGTVEGIPEATALPEVKKALEAKGYTKVVLRPLMVVAGDHANNDMAADEEGSWYYAFVHGGEFEVEGHDEPVDIGDGFGAANVTCQINGLGEITAIQQLYVAHVAAVLS